MRLKIPLEFTLNVQAVKGVVGAGYTMGNMKNPLGVLDGSFHSSSAWSVTRSRHVRQQESQRSPIISQVKYLVVEINQGQSQGV